MLSMRVRGTEYREYEEIGPRATMHSNSVTV